jgi:hypothetical protein
VVISLEKNILPAPLSQKNCPVLKTAVTSGGKSQERGFLERNKFPTPRGP